MSPCSQHTADCLLPIAGESPGIASICFSGLREFDGKLSAMSSLQLGL